MINDNNNKNVKWYYVQFTINKALSSILGMQ